MNRNDVLKQITEIGRDVFEDESLELDENTKATDVDGWDSLSHLTFINEIEETFDIRFALGEVMGSKNLGELISALLRHISEKE